MSRSKKKKPARETGQDLKLAVEVANRAQLHDVRLLLSECKQTPRPGHKGSYGFEIKHRIVSAERPKGNLIPVVVRFTFTGFQQEPDLETEPSVTIEAAFLLLYSLSNDEGITEDHVKAFADLNGVYNAWPYWREFVQNTIARMELPPLTIPVFRIVSPDKTKPPKKMGKKADAKKGTTTSRRKSVKKKSAAKKAT